MGEFFQLNCVTTKKQKQFLIFLWKFFRAILRPKNDGAWKLYWEKEKARKKFKYTQQVRLTSFYVSCVAQLNETFERKVLK